MNATESRGRYFSPCLSICVINICALAVFNFIHDTTSSLEFAMFAVAVFAVGLLSLTPSVFAHGYLKSIEVGGKSYLAWQVGQDRKSTRLNSSHMSISYAV